MPKIMNFNDTITYIIENKVSISRFGDGEIKWILNDAKNSFQENSYELSIRLQEVLANKCENVLICIPDVFCDLNRFRFTAKRFWRLHLNRYRKAWMIYLNKDYYFGDSLISRPYISYRDKNDSSQRFKLLKKLWNNHDVLIVEGEKTFFGVGNDLLDDVNSVRRIICPAENAFLFYTLITRKQVNGHN
jgi:glycosyltransferase family protein